MGARGQRQRQARERSVLRCRALPTRFRRDDLKISIEGRRTLLVIQLAENLADDLAHALQRLEIVLCLVEGLLSLFYLVAEPPDLGVELLRWSKSRDLKRRQRAPGAQVRSNGKTRPGTRSRDWKKGKRDEHYEPSVPYAATSAFHTR